MLRTRLLRTASFRLTALYAVLFVASACLLFAFVYWIAGQTMRDQLAGVIQGEAEDLARRFESANSAGLVDAIGERLHMRGRRPAYYLLQDTQGRVLAGNLPAIPPVPGLTSLEPPRDALDTETDPGEVDEHSILGYGVALPGGLFLLAGEDSYSIVEAEEALFRAFGLASAVTLLLALAGGAALSTDFLRRIGVIARTSRAIIDGDLQARIPLRGTADEFDQLAASLNEMLDRIHLLMESVRQISNDIAHDLRTPLGRLRQKLESIPGTDMGGSSGAALDEAIAEADAILDTFSALLRIAQIEAGARRSGFRDLDLSAVFRLVADTYAVVAEDGGHDLFAEIADGIRILGDRDLLVQMLANLIENALRHTPAGTRVHLSLALRDGMPAGAVADRGPGIPEGERGRVFRRFYRLDKSRSTSGNGLGLALVAAVAELHRIALTLEDNGPGLRVTLSFPGGG